MITQTNSDAIFILKVNVKWLMLGGSDIEDMYEDRYIIAELQSLHASMSKIQAGTR